MRLCRKVRFCSCLCVFVFFSCVCVHVYAFFVAKMACKQKRHKCAQNSAKTVPKALLSILPSVTPPPGLYTLLRVTEQPRSIRSNDTDQTHPNLHPHTREGTSHISEKKPMSAKIVCAGNGCANFTGAWDFWGSFCRRTCMPIKFSF